MPKLSYKARRRWALIILLLALPIYVIVAVNFTDWLRARYEGMGILAELLVFVGLGVVWIIPLKPVFQGIGQNDPDTPPEDRDD